MIRACDTRREHGLTLVELLVAAAIGSIVLGAAVQALTVTSRHYARAQALAQMQEQVDVALRFLRDDLRLAGHWGALRTPAAIAGRALPGDDNPHGLPMPSRCATRFTTDLARTVVPADTVDDWQCDVDAVAGNHAITVRYARPEVATPQHLRLQLTGDTREATLTASAAPAGTTPGAAVRDLAVRGYYVAAASTVFPDQPVLRRLTLNAYTSGPVIIDEEIAQGVEALRIAAHVDLDGDHAADAVLPPGDALLQQVDAAGLPVHDVLAVDVAVVVRSELPRWRNAGAHAFELLGQGVAFPADGYLRIAAVQTVQLRNSAWPR